jgi:DNA recombination protein RmuC
MRTMTEQSLIFGFAPAAFVLFLVVLAGALYAAWQWRRADSLADAAQRDLAGAKARLEAMDVVKQERDAALAAREAAQDAAATLRAEVSALASAASERAKAVDDKEHALTALRAEVEAQFQALAAQALAASQQQFLALADESFKKHQASASGGVKEVLAPVQEAFAKLSVSVEAIEKARLTDKSTLAEQMRTIGETLKETQGVTGKLVNALRASPKARGRWGEQTLRNVLELSGLAANVDFFEQASVEGEVGKLRPDVVIHLPGGRSVVVDSKVALSAYLDAIEAVEEGAREALLKKHAQELRTHMKQLSGKEYWKHVGDTVDFVVLFVPGESFLSAALERDPALLEDGFTAKVIIATPTTMVALAKSVAYGWRQDAAAKNAQEIAELGRELYRRVALMGDRLTGLGNQIEKSVKAYNELIGSVESRVLPSARKFKDLGAGDADHEIEALAPVELAPRLPAPQGELSLPAPPAAVGSKK